MTKSSRIEFIDLLRGFSLLGILAVNLPFFSHNLEGAPPVDSRLDILALWLVAFAGHAKFFVIFSFLFGYGLALQLQRADERGIRLMPRYLRRLAGLFGLGILHAVFFFPGDILTQYALLGLVLWFCRGWSTRGLLALCASSYMISLIAYGGLGALSAIEFPEGPEYQAYLERSDQAYLGTFWSATEQRLDDLPFALMLLFLFNTFPALSMFALGLVAGRMNWLSQVDERLPHLNRMLPWTLALGIIGNALYATYGLPASGIGPDMNVVQSTLATLALGMAWPPMAFSYIVILARLRRVPVLGFIMNWLRSSGRMSLTNYLLESVLAGFVFLGWGLGYYGKTGPFACLGLTFVLFGVLATFSRIWLTFYLLGPEEWLLRSWTSLRWAPLRARRNECPQGPGNQNSGSAPPSV